MALLEIPRPPVSSLQLPRAKKSFAAQIQQQLLSSCFSTETARDRVCAAKSGVLINTKAKLRSVNSDNNCRQQLILKRNLQIVREPGVGEMEGEK